MIRGLGLGAPWLNKWLFVTLCWFIGNWWAHDNLHMRNGLNIEVGFHITMLICGVTLALSLVRLSQHSSGKVDASEKQPVQTAA